MDRNTIKSMSRALKAYSRTRSLLPLSKDELLHMPKEVIIACASEEIAYVWDKLPKQLQEDPDILKYGYCSEHHNADQAEGDVNDGPPPRRIFCCICNIQDVNIMNNEDEPHNTNQESVNCSNKSLFSVCFNQ